MIPLPFGIATSMSAPLQRISTKLTCFALQVMGQPAFAEGNVVVIGDVKLEVAQACSGLKMFIQFVAMAYGYAVVLRRPWWERVCLFAAIAPFCILANSTRITLVGLMDLYTTLPHVRSDFMAGLVVIVLAFSMFGGLLWYLSVLISEEEVMDMSFLVRDADA
jgi:exosortase